MIHGYWATTAGALAAFTGVALLLRAGAPRFLTRVLGKIESPSVWVSLSVATLLGFVACLVVNVAYEGYVDHVEPNIASVSWLFLKGQPLYHGVDDPARYSLLYGPTGYLFYAGALWLGGGSHAALKIAVLVANVGTIGFLWGAYRSVLGARAALLTLAMVLWLLFVPRPNSYLFQVRADVWMVTAVAAGLFAASRRSGWSGVVLAISAACAVNGKMSGVFYILPVFAGLASRRGWPLAVKSALAATGLGTLPFLLPNVSLASYLAWVHEGSRHPCSAGEFLGSVRTLAALLLPLLLIAGTRPWRNPALVSHARASRLPWLTLGFSLAVVLALSSKLGAGAHHLIPFVPTLGYEAALLYRATGSVWAARYPLLFRYSCGCVGAFVVARAAGGLSETSSLVREEWSRARRVAGDVRTILKRRGGRVEMGYGEREAPETFYRLPLVVANDHLSLDDQALNDMQLAGVEVPQATVNELPACTTSAWLVPKGQVPFGLGNFYGVLAPLQFPQRPLFSTAFREAFARSYQKSDATDFFDVWVCNGSRVAP